MRTASVLDQQPKQTLPYQLVWIGFFLLPFENLIIAPSAGWPAISPIFFLAALILTKKQKIISKRTLKIIGGLSVLSCIGWLAASIHPVENRYFIRDIALSIPPLIMGYAFYQSTYNLISSPNPKSASSFKNLMDALILGSKIALLFSIIIFLFTQVYRTPAFIEILEFVLKRNHETLRFSFTFAEPSFVSVHILGVLAPFAWLSWRLGHAAQMKSLVKIILIYIVLSIFFLKSARFLIDASFLIFIFLLFYSESALKSLPTKKLVLFVSLAAASIYLAIINPGIIEYITYGRVNLESNFIESINSDASLASRYFRTDSVIQAFTQNPHLLLTGVGYGNIGFLVDLGYQGALHNFTSLYTKEVYDIYIEGSGPNIFNMFARFIGEFGLISFAIVMYLLYNKKTSFLFFITLWCYLQFDSYAFYAIWIYLLAKSVIPGKAIVQK